MTTEEELNALKARCAMLQELVEAFVHIDYTGQEDHLAAVAHRARAHAFSGHEGVTAWLNLEKSSARNQGVDEAIAIVRGAGGRGPAYELLRALAERDVQTRCDLVESLRVYAEVMQRKIMNDEPDIAGAAVDLKNAVFGLLTQYGKRKYPEGTPP